MINSQEEQSNQNDHPQQYDYLNQLEEKIGALIDLKNELESKVDSLNLQINKLEDELLKANQARKVLSEHNQTASLQIQRIIAQLKEEINAA